ncbi:hypothetical protein GFS24_12875 [Chitinophaga sp. SYP-B3965]|uniref:S41 family peptidase n=1 Tax=Chitinophaga sp. SYP-B3965 TaxID=2663120 RepID=UPI001299B1F9|nr:S41 family peptidase [Chitinophaga sp. SYP-B3965]MRG46014.1 hypothetical protein [Chitinophaga sp. SYP-B3965]
MKIFLFVWAFFIPLMGAVAQQFSKADLVKDLNYAEKALRETHPGLFRYQSKQQFDSNLAATYAQIKDSMDLRDYYEVTARFISSIRCAHTVIIPTANWSDTLYKARYFFPFQIYFLEGTAHLLINRSQNQDVKPGSVLLAINGRPINDIVQNIFRHLFADGANETLKYMQIQNVLFSYYYNLFIERADSFHIEYINQEGKRRNVTLPGVGMEEGNKYAQANPVNKEILEGIRKETAQKSEPRQFRINSNTSTATIVLREFYGGQTGEEARQKLKHFMDDAMTKIQEQHIKNLVIDLRNNSGGYDSQGQELLTYFIQQPLRYYKSMHTITYNSPFLAQSSVSEEERNAIATGKLLIPQPDSTFLLTEQVNPTLGILQPKPNGFRGKVYYLVNGATGSATAEFTAVAHSLKTGVFIGEETGGNYTGGNGSEFVALRLPVTKMPLMIPLVYYCNNVEEPGEKGRGTIPDHQVPYILQDLLTGVDTQLEFTYRLIEKQK